MAKHQFSHETLSAFTLGLAHLLHAGLPTGDALALMAQDEEDKGLAPILSEMSRKADEGESLSAALTQAGAFPPYVLSMVSAGEETGRTEEALFALSDYYEGRARLDHQLQSALLHPLLLMGVLLVVIGVLLGWVLPVFEDVYRQLGSSLTGLAGGLLTLGNLLRGGLPVLLPLALALCAGVAWMACSQKGREKFISLAQGKSEVSLVDAARLTQVLAMALNSGLDEERSMELALDLGEENSPLRKRCKDCLEKLQGSETLPQALSSCKLLTAADARLLEAGIQGGRGDTVMTQLSKRIQERSESRIEAWMGRIEPTLVLTASILVGVILLSVLLPLTRIMAAIG